MNYKYRIKHQFDTVMKREKQTITDYLSGVTYTVFFRTKSRSKDTNEQLRLYYAEDTAINNGTIFTYKNENYIVINKQADESNCFYTSIAQKCTQNVSVNGLNLPFATENIQITTDVSSAVTMIDGTVIIFTGINSYYDKIDVNKTFNAFGNTYKVSNKYQDNGLGYLKCEQTTSVPDTYTLDYTGVDTVSLDDGDTYQLTFEARKNDVTVENPTITYVSSDETIATVDANGLMTMLQAGNVTITATWNDVSANATISIGAVTPPVATMTCEITYRKNYIKAGGSYSTYKAVFYDADGVVITGITPVWSLSSAEMDVSKLTVTNTVPESYKIKISEDYLECIGTHFTITLADGDNTCSSSVVIEIQEYS